MQKLLSIDMDIADRVYGPDAASLSITILINNYNYARFLPRCIESCLQQTYQPLEIILVDDGSVDESRQIMTEYAALNQQIIPVFKVNAGQASAVNAGFRRSHGDIIVLLDADDYLHPWALEKIAQAWCLQGSGPQASLLTMVQCRLDLVDADGQYIDQYPAPEIAFDSGNVVPRLLATGQSSTTVTSGLSFSRTVLEQILPMPEADFRLCADGYLVTLAPFYGTVASVEVPIGGRRKHGENLWARGDGSVTQLHRAIRHDFMRYRYLAQTAQSLGHVPVLPLGRNDPGHLTQRLASLRLAAAQHPIQGDRVLTLTGWGIQATWRYSNLRWRRRLVLMLWFLAVGLLPQSLAQPIVRWRLFGQSRPASVDWALKSLRRATQA